MGNIGTGLTTLKPPQASRLVRLPLLGLFSLAGCVSLTATFAPETNLFTMPDHLPLVWEASYTSTPPAVDGRIDQVWSTAKPLTVNVREAMGGGHPRPVVLRALYTDDSLYVLAQWPDATASGMRDPYVWNPQTHRYDRPTKPDDQFALEFPIQGDFDLNMLTVDHAYVADVWHWKAGRSNLGGWVDDKRHVISQSAAAGAKEYRLGGHGTVYIQRPMDAGRASYTVTPAPTHRVGNVVASFGPQEPSGSQADIRGQGLHDGRGWTLEMTRKLDTGHPDDAVIDVQELNLCAIAVLDDELYWRHSVSTRLHLRFVPR
ncbi:MAG: hypothetical protein IID37_06525 [Planctomycetes bacterium]|nr:hypothetical protein [Planctomycetota bacterium]